MGIYYLLERRGEMANESLGSHPATGDSPQRRGHGGFPDAADSTTLLEETQVEWYLEDCFAPVVEEALVETQKKIGRYKGECKMGPWFFDLVRGKTIIVPCNLKTCAICRRKLAKRYAQQIEYENISRYDTVRAGRWNAYRKALGRRELRYKSFPAGDGIIVVSAMGEVELPTDVAGFLDGVIARAAHGCHRRISGSRGFGGEHTGYRGKKRGRYWRPSARWSLADVYRDIGIALGDAIWRLLPHVGDDGFSLLGELDDVPFILELGGIVGVSGEVVW